MSLDAVVRVIITGSYTDGDGRTAYCWEQVDDRGNVYVDGLGCYGGPCPPSSVGSTLPASGPAYECNGRTDVPLDSIVEIWPSDDETGDVDTWEFELVDERTKFESNPSTPEFVAPLLIATESTGIKIFDDATEARIECLPASETQTGTITTGYQELAGGKRLDGNFAVLSDDGTDGYTMRLTEDAMLPSQETASSIGVENNTTGVAYKIYLDGDKLYIVHYDGTSTFLEFDSANGLLKYTDSGGSVGSFEVPESIRSKEKYQTHNGTTWVDGASGTGGGGDTIVNGIVTALGSGGGGTVTSVGLTAPSILNVSGTPVTASGTLALTLANQSANAIFAGPASGGAAAPTFRAMAVSDLPLLNGFTDESSIADGDRFPFYDTSATANRDCAASELKAYIGVPVAATQAEQETGTSTTTFVTPENQKYNDSSCKFWVVFTVSGGSVTVRDSYNVDSVTRNSVGDFTINLTTDFSGSYSCVAGSSSADKWFLDSTTSGPGTIEVGYHNGSSARTDPGQACVCGFGDL